MRVLSEADLERIGDPTAKTKRDNTPTDCFYLTRDVNCTIIRPPFEEEEDAWWHLMESACQLHGIDFDTFEPEWWDYYQKGRQRVVEMSLGEKGEEDGEHEDEEDGDEDENVEGDKDAEADSAESLHQHLDEDEEIADAVETHP